MAVAPYVDITLHTVPDLGRLPARGIDVVNLAFVTAQGQACRPAWGGVLRYDDPEVLARVRRLRAAGGDARVSFGGQSAHELALTCPTPEPLAAAYGQVVDALRVTLIDLDVEGRTLTDAAAVHRRNLAVRLLQTAAQQRGRPLRISYTLPADSDGLTNPARALLRDARDTGVHVDVVNAMTMDMGTQEDLATASISSAEGVERFLRGLEGAGNAEAWGRIALTPMIGRNDVPDEVFRLQDAARLADFARRHGLAWISFWSLNRDQACGAGTPPTTASPGCSGVLQQPGEYTSTFAGRSDPGTSARDR